MNVSFKKSLPTQVRSLAIQQMIVSLLLPNLPDPEPYIFWLINIDCSGWYFWDHSKAHSEPAQVFITSCMLSLEICICGHNWRYFHSSFGTCFLWLSEPHVSHIVESLALNFPFFYISSNHVQKRIQKNNVLKYKEGYEMGQHHCYLLLRWINGTFKKRGRVVSGALVKRLKT